MISYQYEHRRRALHSPVLLHEAIAGGDGGGGVLKQPRAARTPEQDVEQRHSVPGIKNIFNQNQMSIYDKLFYPVALSPL